MSISGSKRFTLYDIVVVGVMAAVIFALTYFVSIRIPVGDGQTMIKIANGFIMIAGIVLGGLRGGLAGGIGSAIYDLLDPAYISYVPFTLIFFFLMGFVTGIVSKIGKEKGNQILWNVIGSLLGGITYFVLHISHVVILKLLSGSDFTAAVVASSTSMVTSAVNLAVGIVIAALLAPAIKKAIVVSGLYSKMGH